VTGLCFVFIPVASEAYCNSSSSGS